MTFDLQDVARAIGAQPPRGNAPVRGWSTDSRSVAEGDLFFALRGPNHDGHNYIADALAKGAVAAVSTEPRPSGSGLVLLVPDTQQALEILACWARAQWTGTVVGVTGSAGKTTSKDVIAQLVSVEFPVGKTEGNLNNHIGVPLSILRLDPDARVAVIEIGMNHPGEIRHLAAIAQPRIGVVTNVGLAHAGFFDSADQVALAKRELIEALPADGVAVLNADDARVASFRDSHPGEVITFGLSEGADVRPEAAEFGAMGVRFRLEGQDFESSLMGRHGLMNVLAGIAVARVFGIPPARLVDAVRTLAPAKMRGERMERGGVLILNDCYNSNPEAVRSMLDLLRATPARRRFAVLGEMLELGRWSEPLHRDVGRYVAVCGIDVLIGIRGAARHMVDEAVRSGLAGAALFFDDPAEAGRSLHGRPQEGDVVLFKGSRGTQVEKALDVYVENG